MLKLSAWIGSKGGAFERVGLVFEALGYQKPLGDQITGGARADGAYVMNIAAQYDGTLTQRQALDIIAYGLRHSREAIERDPPQSLYSIAGEALRFGR